jgi:hypothetical protein
MFPKEVNMQKNRFGIFLLSVLIGTFFALGGNQEATAGVQVNINIGPPPAFVIAAPPAVVIIPGTYVYAVPDIDVSIFFYHGFWYRPHEGHWFRAKSYNGPWAYLAVANVPRVLVQLPPSYYRVPPGHRHIPYAQLRDNWGRWERERYWHKDKEWQQGWHERPEGRGGEEHGRGGGHNGGRG